MTKKEIKQIQNETNRQYLDIYSGILFNNQKFDEGNNEEIIYDFQCPEYLILKEKYNLEKIAGNGSDFTKAKKLLHYFAPKLTHSSWYDNHVPCNSLDLLEYSLNNPKQGINCLNKSKILEECCLALGIFARRVCIMPYSPYDFDNHVVIEIFERKLKKWIMLDPTTDGLFVDENGIPLSILEIRSKFAKAEFVTFVKSTNKLNDLKKLKEKYMEINVYICKNLFFFYIDQNSTFGTTRETLAFIPINYLVKDNLIANIKYKINNLPDEYKDMLPQFEKQLENLQNYEEDVRTSISSMTKSPIK